MTGPDRPDPGFIPGHAEFGPVPVVPVVETPPVRWWEFWRWHLIPRRRREIQEELAEIRACLASLQDPLEAETQEEPMGLIDAALERVKAGRPDRVLVDARGYADPPGEAGVDPDVFLIRGDGWVLGAPEGFLEAALGLYAGDWVACVVVPRTDLANRLGIEDWMAVDVACLPGQGGPVVGEFPW